MQDPQPVLTEKMKLFARISPENKAMVVRMFKERISSTFA
jgi:magnesium-transporting ATPase (P-type)